MRNSKKMIFVTVGTHEQPFNRLIECMDKLVESTKIKEDVVIQTGYSTYKPKFCKWSKLFTFNDMEKNVAEARIVITHGGPSSFIMPLKIGKTPIVVPRKYKFNEHINNHQVDFCKEVAERMGTIIVVENINKLGEVIQNYEVLAGKMNNDIKSNNKYFNEKLEKLVEQMFMS